MQLADAPVKIVEPFAQAGDKNAIPVTSGDPTAASWALGFPPLTGEDPSAGGVGPSRLDFNGVYSEVSALSRWFNAGAGFTYDPAFVTAVGGYPLGARVLRADHAGYWLNTVDANTSDPDTGGAGWIIDGARATSSVYASAQQTLGVGASKIMFDSVEFDAGLWDAGNKRFLAPQAGKYRVNGAVYLPAPAGQSFAAEIWKNGGLAKRSFQAPQVSDIDITLPFDAIISCAAGDFIELFLEVTQTAVLAGIVGSNEPYVFAQCEYLG